MADRDWEKELAKIDKQLGSLSDEELAAVPKAPVKGGAPAGAAVKALPPAKGAGAAAVSAEPRATKSWAVYARLTLSVALGVGMVLWPYPARCGPGLAAYLAAVIVVVTSGVWSSIWTWRHRASHAHTLSLLLILWGLVLGSMEVLPRVGYAKPNALHPAQWACVSNIP
jgi:hypothetical protein